MGFELRPYQRKCVEDIKAFINGRDKRPGVVVAPVGSGKSLLIAETARMMGDKVLVLQPSKELLEQNVDKLRSLGGEATIFSASCKSKELSGMTYATLGSIAKVVKEIKGMGIDQVIIDEVHAGYPPDPDSMFMRFMNELGPKRVIGFTATPCRLKTMMMGSSSVSQLNLITRMNPGYFKNIIHVTQVGEMVKEGFWSPLVYERWSFDGSCLTINSGGSEYTEESISMAIKENGTNNLILKRLLSLNDRRSILVFMDSVENCEIASKWINQKMGDDASVVVHGGMTKKKRDAAVKGFKEGKIKIVFNHSVLLTGFDHPGLDCMIFGRPTFSFSTYYQAVGREVRVKEGKKDALFIDCCSNMDRFGDVRNIVIEDIPGWGWGIRSGERIITNVPMEETLTRDGIYEYKANMRLPMSVRPVPGRKSHPIGDTRMDFGMYKGYLLRAVPTSYLSFVKNNMDLSYRPELREYINFLNIK